MRITPLRYRDVAEKWHTELCSLTEGSVSFLEGTLHNAETNTVVPIKQIFWGVVLEAAGCVVLFEQPADGDNDCESEKDAKGNKTLSRWIFLGDATVTHHPDCGEKERMTLSRCIFLGGAAVTHQPEDDVVRLRLVAPLCEQCVDPTATSTPFDSQWELHRVAGTVELSFLSTDDACEWYLSLERTIHLASQMVFVSPPSLLGSSIRINDRTPLSANVRSSFLTNDFLDVLQSRVGIGFDSFDDSGIAPLRRSQFLDSFTYPKRSCSPSPQQQQTPPQQSFRFSRYVTDLQKDMYDAAVDLDTQGFCQSAVFVTKRRADQVSVAVKTVLTDKETFPLFESEVRLLAMAQHSNIVKLLAVHRSKLDQHLFYMVMEYMSGGKLSDVILPQEGKKKTWDLLTRLVLSEEEISAIMFCIVMALEYLHERDIVHGDLKTDNILCAANGTVKLADFGHAQFLSGSGLLTRRTGTRLWQAPELQDDQRRREGYGKAVDVWSLGIVFLELCDGLPPSETAPKRISAANGARRSDEAHRFAAFLLQPDPTDRPSIGAVKAHPFLQQRLSTRFLAEIILAKQ